ncbi:Siah interacting protein N-terminal [Trinorchestia longiramus]|nr:Siah interacting protein N-terminal [Trinorchestia longiramus]
MSQISEVTLDLEELKKLRDIAERKSVQEFLDIQIRKTADCLERLKVQESLQSSIPTQNKTPDSSSRVYTVTLRTYSWDQSDNFLKLYVTIPGLKPSDEAKVKGEFGDNSVSLTVHDVNGKNYQLTINNLAKKISPDKSYCKTKSEMVVLMLRKEHVGHSWKYVTAEEVKIHEKNKVDTSDSIKDDPSSGMMDIMKRMYDDGDDSMKRMLNKTWYETQHKKMDGFGGMPPMDDLGI